MPRRASRLTKRDLDALRRQAQADPSFTKILADAGQPGLCVRASRGKVNFVFRYRPPLGGRRQSITIDEYGAITLDRARLISQEWRAQVAGRVDPKQALAERRLQALTVAEAIEGYLDDLRERAESGAKRGKRSGYVSAKRRLERHNVQGIRGASARQVSKRASDPVY